MTPLVLLDELQAFVIKATKDIVLMSRERDENDKRKESKITVFKMRLPNKEAETQQVPYILLQFINGKDLDDSDDVAYVRIVFTSYCEDREQGSLDVLNVLSTIRTNLLKLISLGGYFTLKRPLEYMVYPEDTSPYYMGEMMTIWQMPDIKKEVQQWL